MLEEFSIISMENFIILMWHINEINYFLTLIHQILKIFINLHIFNINFSTIHHIKLELTQILINSGINTNTNK